jgi:transcription initiation factor TFIIIB Brf1 subunit/transcription initiation factor TFIIB
MGTMTKSKVTVSADEIAKLKSELQLSREREKQAQEIAKQAQDEIAKLKKSKAYNYNASLNDNLRTRSVIAFLKDVTQDYADIQKIVNHNKVGNGYLGSIRIAIHAMIKDEALRKSVINQLNQLSS